MSNTEFEPHESSQWKAVLKTLFYFDPYGKNWSVLNTQSLIIGTYLLQSDDVTVVICWTQNSAEPPFLTSNVWEIPQRNWTCVEKYYEKNA